MEIWESVEFYEGIYEVSNLGKVRTCKGKTTHSKLHGKRIWEQRELKQKTDKGGYKRVCLYKDKKAKDFLVHRLVAGSFCEKEEGKNIINHKDAKPENNVHTNLEWCDYTENLIHAYLNKLNLSPTEITLVNKKTKEPLWFYSMSEAGKYIGKANGYISGLIKRGKFETKDFYIIKDQKN